MAYAESTQVPVDRSKSEIERILVRYGATKFASMWSERGAVIAFEAHGRTLRFALPLPRASSALKRVHEQAVRSRWRALALVIKAKLEAVESGITTFESEFLAHIVLPSGELFGEWASPKLAEVYRGGALPLLLAETSPRDREEHPKTIRAEARKVGS